MPSLAFSNELISRIVSLHCTVSRLIFLHFWQSLVSADVKKRVAEAVPDKQEAVAMTTAIQEEIFLEMGVGIPKIGISCLGKVSTVHENDLDLVIQFYRFLSKEEMACDEAKLGEEFAEKMLNQQNLQEQGKFI
ncbi:hypothetical protein CR513_45331, partial [Mucuna pruriens]